MSRKNPNPDWVADGLRFSAAIDQAGLTRAEFATAMRIGVDTLSRMLAGKQSMHNHFFRLHACRVLGCTMEVLDGFNPAELSGFGEEYPVSKRTRSGGGGDRSVSIAWAVLSGGLAALMALAVVSGSYHPVTAVKTDEVAYIDNWARLEEQYRPNIPRYPGACTPGHSGKVRV